MNREQSFLWQMLGGVDTDHVTIRRRSSISVDPEPKMCINIEIITLYIFSLWSEKINLKISYHYKNVN